MQRIKRWGMDYATGSGTAALTISPCGPNSQVVARLLSFDSPAAGTLDFYRASMVALANAAVSAGTTLVVKTNASGYVRDGAVLTTNDKVLVQNPTTKAWVLSAISSVASVSSSTVSLGLGTSITCAADGPIYLVRSADIVSTVVGDETTRLDYAFSSYPNMPVYVLQTATGANKVAVSWFEMAVL